MSVSRAASLKVPQHDLEYVLISRSNIISLPTHADHLSDQQSRGWNAPACQQGVLIVYTPSQIICQRLLGVLCCLKHCWMYLWLRHLSSSRPNGGQHSTCRQRSCMVFNFELKMHSVKLLLPHCSKQATLRPRDKIYYSSSDTYSSA